MTYKLAKEREDGKVVKLSLGIAEIDAYLKFLQYRCRPNTWISYGYDLQVFLNTLNKPIGEVTPLDILAFIEKQKETPRLHAKTVKGYTLPDSNLCNRTIKRRLTTISGLYEYLRVFQLCSLKDNPVPKGLTKRTSFWGHRFSNSAVTPLLRAPEELPRPLDAREINRFINSLQHQRDKAILLLMLLAGLRKSEVLKLTLADINFGQHTLFVREGKGGFSRTVAISDTGLKQLRNYLEKESPDSSSDRVFLVLKGPHRGMPMSLKGLDTLVAYHRLKADTPGLQCHRLRHTCFTQLRRGGMSLEAIQAQAGHRSIETTRLGYQEQDSKNQFRPLLCLMVWAQKPLEVLTPEDLEDFIQALRTAFAANKRYRKHSRQGLPRRWDYHLKSVRKVLYHMGIFPQLASVVSLTLR